MNDDVVLVRVARPLLDHLSKNDSEPVVILGIYKELDGTYDMVLRRVLTEGPYVSLARLLSENALRRARDFVADKRMMADSNGNLVRAALEGALQVATDAPEVPSMPKGLQGGVMDDEIEYSANSLENDSGVYRLDFRNMTVEKGEPERVSPNRQGWRARLANVERLLREMSMEDTHTPFNHSRLIKALAEVRSMLDGDNEAKP